MVPFPQRVRIGPAIQNLTYRDTKLILSCKFDIEMSFETSWRYGKLSWKYFENFSWIRDGPPITTSQKWGFPKQSFTCMSQAFGMHVLALKYKEEEPSITWNTQLWYSVHLYGFPKLSFKALDVFHYQDLLQQMEVTLFNRILYIHLKR